jgi:hypothetical protein
MPIVVRGTMKPIPTLIRPLPSVDLATGEAQPTRYERSDVTSVPAARPTGRLNTRTAPVPVTPDSPHAVVIGAGFGGLAAAVRLGARGYRVTVVDRLDQPGGRARVFRQDGFAFDAGPTVITAPFLFEELWALCGKRLEDDVDIRPVTPFYRIPVCRRGVLRLYRRSGGHAARGRALFAG